MLAALHSQGIQTLSFSAYAISLKETGWLTVFSFSVFPDIMVKKRITLEINGTNY